MKLYRKRKAPIVRVNPVLDQYDGQVLFPDKLEKANDVLARTVLPISLEKIKKIK